MENFNLVRVTPENTEKETLFCSRDPKSEGFRCKHHWLGTSGQEASIYLLQNQEGKPVAFIEFMRAEAAWRPVRAESYLFIQCIFVYPNLYKNQGAGSSLLALCENEARKYDLQGVCTITSNGPWIHDKRLFLENGFVQVDQKGRFELLAKKFHPDHANPALIDWERDLRKYQGWHLIYADQCPWHAGSVSAIKKVADELGIELHIRKLNSALEAQTAPSGFGTFSLIYNGKLIEDHYLSETRVRSIFRKHHTSIPPSGTKSS